MELFIQSLWYPLKHVATSCNGIERGYVKKSVWECVCFGCVIKKSVKKYRQEEMARSKGSLEENAQWVG